MTYQLTDEFKTEPGFQRKGQTMNVRIYSKFFPGEPQSLSIFLN